MILIAVLWTNLWVLQGILWVNIILPNNNSFINFFCVDIDSFPKEYVWSASMYLVGKTFESLREMFTSTKEIQVRKYLNVTFYVLHSIALEYNFQYKIGGFCRLFINNCRMILLCPFTCINTPTSVLWIYLRDVIIWCKKIKSLFNIYIVVFVC